MKMYYKLDDNGRIITSSILQRDEYLLLEQPTFENAVWNGENWVIDAERQVLLEAALAKQELVDIDIASVRSIREYLSTLENCPKQLKDHEKLAKEKRKKITNINKKTKNK